MNLVKIGQVVINFEQVRYVRDQGTMGSGAPMTIDFGHGQTLDLHAQVDALRTWLAANSTNVTP